MLNFNKYNLLIGRVLALVLALQGLGPRAGVAQTAKSSKRGLAYGYHSAADLQALAPGLSWWYNWANTPEAGAASVYTQLGIDYVPMQWNKMLNNNVVTASQLAPLIPAGATYLLGFNEPNFLDQANLPPTQAAALWPVLQSVAQSKGLKLVSPAVNYCGNCVAENGVTYYSPVQYLDAFFAACPSCQVDYIAVHTYVCEEKYLREKIAELKKYNKPIWLTEFACGDMAASQITLGVQQKYLLDAVNYLEKEPAIFRYAWFSGRNTQIPNINLLGADGQLTALGQAYVRRPAGWEAGRFAPVATTASSQESPTTGAANAADVDINTRWASVQGPGPQWVQLDFGSVKSFSRVLLSWEAAYATDYQVQTSLDGAAWTTIQTVANGDGGVDDLTGLSGQGRYLRINATQRGTAYGYSLYEVEAFGAAAPLPVTLTAFQAVPQGPAVALTWATATEQHNQGFDVQRSSDGVQFADLAFVPGVGSSLQAHTYQYLDAQPQRATASYYRLRQRDLDGSATYSPVQVVAAAAGALSVYPNPVTDQATLVWQAAAAAASRWHLTNAEGQLLHSETVSERAGLNYLPLDLRPYPAGTYVLTLESTGHAPQHTKVLKTE
jgi:hypothetical protein